MAGEEFAAPLVCGSATHEALAEYFRGKSAAEALAVYETLYRDASVLHGLDDPQHPLGLDDPKHPLARLSYSNTRAILAEWFETHPLRAFPFRVRPEHVEVGFSVSLADDVAFVGRLDAIVEGDDGWYVLDHKTTGRLSPATAERYRMDSQMSGYVWAAQQTLGLPIRGVYINAIEYALLPKSTRSCKTHGVPYYECGPLHARSELLLFTRTPDQLDAWRQSALALAERYRALQNSVQTLEDLTAVPQEGTFSGACGQCLFQRFCAAGRPVAYGHAMLTHQPWEPFPIKEPNASNTD